VVYLHTGLTREELDDKYDYDDGTALQGKEGWVPIVHRSITAANVLLHFLGAEGEGGEVADPLEMCFPQTVLEGFDQANQLDDPEAGGAEARWSTGKVSRRSLAR
jgi:hypothetical protein